MYDKALNIICSVVVCIVHWFCIAVLVPCSLLGNIDENFERKGWSIFRNFLHDNDGDTVVGCVRRPNWYS